LTAQRILVIVEVIFYLLWFCIFNYACS